MTQLQQIISRIQSGKLTRENDIDGVDGFWDLLSNDFRSDGDRFYYSNILWDLYETLPIDLENKLTKITQLSEQLDEIISQE